MKHANILILSIVCYSISLVLFWAALHYGLQLSRIWWIDWALPLIWSAIFPTLVFRGAIPGHYEKNQVIQWRIRWP